MHDNAPAIRSENAAPTSRPSSLCSSDSNEELVVFSGRSREKKAAARLSHTSQSLTEQVTRFRKLQPFEPEDSISNTADRSDQTISRTKIDPFSRGRPFVEKNSAYHAADIDTGASLNTHVQLTRLPGNLNSSNELRMQSQRHNVPGTTLKQPQTRDFGNEWSLSDIDDFRDLSTSEELQDNILSIIAERYRNNGTQYLVVWEGQSVDDARWITASSLVMHGAREAIEAFQMTGNGPSTSQKTHQEEDDSDSWESEDEAEEDTFGHLIEERLIESDLRNMSDAQIARILGKQEELGLGSEQVVLFDDGFYRDRGGILQASSVNEDTKGVKNLMNNSILDSAGSRQKKNSNDKSSSANVIDERLYTLDGRHGKFDPIDYYVLGNGLNKGKSRNMPHWDVSDSELEEALYATWHADRNKKKQQKLKRDDMRAQGLLVKTKGAKLDSRDRHKLGISTGQIKLELEQFLFNDHESHAFQPMDKRDRKSLHEIASLFRLKSMSKGSGKNRFPVLYKTKRTLPFDQKLWARLESHLDRKFFQRSDLRGSAKKAMGSYKGEVSYREGEIVGGTAAELSADNRGRAMLERMGWTNGTALGTAENKGMLDPVTHVVKKTRAGLG